jgi:hypothetical protein
LCNKLQVDAGIQCQYILELVQRSENGELVNLPPEIPNVEKFKRDIRHQKNRVMFLEKALTICMCEENATRKKQLLSSRLDPNDPDLRKRYCSISLFISFLYLYHSLIFMDYINRPNSSQDSSDLSAPRAKFARMGSAMDRKGLVVLHSLLCMICL